MQDKKHVEPRAHNRKGWMGTKTGEGATVKTIFIDVSRNILPII